MSSKIIWVVVGPDGRAIEILKNRKHMAQQSDRAVCVEMLRSDATYQIRCQVYERDGHACTHCGTPVTPTTMHMHERLWRGRGGEISLSNSVTLCADCHLHSDVAGHGKRSVQWSHG